MTKLAISTSAAATSFLNDPRFIVFLRNKLTWKLLRANLSAILSTVKIPQKQSAEPWLEFSGASLFEFFRGEVFGSSGSVRQGQVVSCVISLRASRLESWEVKEVDS
jgi:hypothetical protein